METDVGSFNEKMLLGIYKLYLEDKETLMLKQSVKQIV